MLIAGRGRAWVARLNASADGELFRIDLGHDQNDAVNAIAENADGTIYAAGSMHSRSGDVGFWAQLDASGKQTRFEPLPSPAYAIAIDASGLVYVGGDGFVMQVDGWTIAPPGPVRALALDEEGTLYAAGSKPAEIGAGSDAYIAQLNATHDQWKWTLPIGGTSAADEARALAIGADGSVYAAGVTDSVDFPVKLAYQSRFNGPRDAFLVKVDPNGSGLVWSTYLGGRGSDSAAALAFDMAGNLIVGGSTDSPDFPGGDRWNGAQDGFFARFDTAGHFQEGAYIGTSGLEEINAIAVDHTGAAYAAGSTNLGLEEVLLAAIPMAASRRVGITPSSVTLAVSPTPVSVFGSPVTLTATVSPSSATGTVTYYDGVGVIGSGAVSAGKAILQTVLLPAGARPLSAFYSGDAVYSTSKSTAVTLSVNAVPSLVMGHSTGIPISAGADPRTVATGDFNGDGKADLAIANYYSDSVVVLLGDGAGGFTPAPGISFAAGTRPFFIRAADVNGDGKQDLLMGSTNGNGSKMTVLLGNGNGGFSTANGSPFTVAGGMNSFTVGDFNNDGKVDIVTASISSTVSVMLGDGSGGFTATSPISIGSNATFAVAVSDVNGDGNADIAVTNSANNTVAILLGNGAGGFQLAAGSPFATGGTQPRSIAIGDLNGDGKPDIVTGNASGNVSVLLGNGSGGFAPASGSPIAVGSSTSDIAIGDINGDGKMDLVVAVGLTTISVLLGNGAAGFTPMTGSPYTVEQSPSSIVLADFNGDGRTDIVTVISSSSPKSLSILFGTGPALGIVLSAAPAPTSTLGQLVTLTTAVPASIATGKVTFYDGTTVLGTSPVSAETAVLTTTALPSGSRSLRAYYSGDSNFFAATSPTITQTVTVLPSGVFKGSALSTGAGSQPYGVAAGDFNRDGRQDLAVVHSGSNAVSIWLSNGGGGFTQSAGSPFPVGTTPVAIAVGDVNGDGILDLAVANLGSSTITLLLGNAAGGFTAATGGLIVTGSAPRSIAMGDFNGDGNLDIVTANSGSNNITVLLGNGSGGFAPALGSPFAAGSAPWSIVTGDFNGDGMADLAVANNGSNNVTILLGTGGGAFTAASGSPFAAGANPWALAAGDFNGDGKQDLAVANRDGGSVTVLLGAGGGSFTAAPGSPFAAGSTPVALAVLDFNADGKQDLAVANYDTASVKILIGIGTGGFNTNGPAYLVGANPLSIGVADFNGDARADLAVGGWGSNNVAILLGAAGVNSSTAISISPGSSATLGQQVTITAAVSPSSATGAVTFYDGSTVLGVRTLSAASASFTTGLLPAGVRSIRAFYAGDSNVSASSSVIASITINSVPSVTLNWPAAGTLPLLSSFQGITVGDFNGDGKPDLAIQTNATPGLNIYLGNSSGGFTLVPGSTVALSLPFGGIAADFNGDGKMDLALFSGSTTFPNFSVSVALGDGNGGFTLFGGAVLANGPIAMAAGDFNGDGKADLAVILKNGTVAILLNDGIGGFKPASAGPVTASASAIAIGDFNGDGITDLALTGSSYLAITASSNGVMVLLGDGTGAFTPSIGSPFAVGTNPNSILAADLNGDGKLDLAVANTGSSDVTVLLGNGAGGFSPSSGSPIAAGTTPGAITAADFNGDGKLDLAVTDSINGRIILLIGNGSGGFAEGMGSPRVIGGSPSLLVAADFNGDGRADLATLVNISNPYLMILSGVTASTTTVTVTPAPSVLMSQPVTISATAAPSTATGQVIFYDGGLLLGQATLIGGSASITARLQTAGTHSLYATYKGDLKNAASTSAHVIETIVAYPSSSYTSALFSPFPVGGNPYYIATGDFNGDGKPDLAIANFLTDNVSILLGTGSGGFVEAAGSPIKTGGISPLSIAIGDFNRDGKLDLAVTNADSNNVSILIGNGSGGFTQPSGVPFITRTAPISVTVGDFNGDGKPDLAIVYDSGELDVLLGDGTGSFPRPDNVTYAVGSGASGVVAGDFNGDGKTDLAAISSNNGTVTILLGNGSGGFTSAAGSPYAVGVDPTSLVITDFNGDGKQDLAVVNYVSSSVNILLGTGTGSFTNAPGSPFSAGANPTFVAAGDFNGDGKPDLVITDGGSKNVLVILGNGLGGFTSGSYLPQLFTAPSSVAVGDFNGDGRADLAVTDYYGNSVSILLGSGVGIPSSIAAVGGSGQSAQVNAAFPIALQAKVTDSTGSPVSGVTVSFSVPAFGPSATFASGNTAGTNAAGVASVTASSNAIGGSYTVTASVSGTASTASFTLTNLGGAVSITGQVTGASGVTITLSGSQSSSTVANGAGSYSFSGLAAGGSFTVTPSLAGYIFTPPSAAFTNLQSIQTANFTGSLKSVTPDKVGTTYSGYSVLDANGNFAWDGPATDKLISWSTFQSGEKPIYGDWNGDGKTKVGVYNNGTWLLDYNGNGVWDGPTVDKAIFWSTGQSSDVPVLGDWNGDGKTKIGIYNNGTWILDFNGNGIWEGPSVDKTIYWSTAQAGEVPVVGDWSGDGKTKIGVHANGTWILDYNGNFAWDGTGIDKLIFFGGAGYRPMLGDWNGSGWTKIGAYHVSGTWALDYNGNFVWDGTSIDRLTFFGGPEWTPIVGDWSAGGTTKIGAYTNGQWALDYNGNFAWDVPPDKLFSFGAAGQTPIVGKW